MAVFTKRTRKHIFLHPKDRHKPGQAVKSALLQDKKKYSDKLDGALLDVSGIQIVGDRHLVVNGHLSIEVVADFHVFSPQVGQTLQGVINKKSRGHLGCLVLETFNAALAVPPESQLAADVGDGCSFKVTEVVVDGDILFLRGSLSSVTSKETQQEICHETAVVIKQEPEDEEMKEEDSAMVEVYLVGKQEHLSEEDLFEESKSPHKSPKKKAKSSPSKIKKNKH